MNVDFAHQLVCKIACTSIKPIKAKRYINDCTRNASEGLQVMTSRLFV